MFGQTPNIQGKIGNVMTTFNVNDGGGVPFNPEGCFYAPTFTDGVLHYLAGTNIGDKDGIGFKASLSSSVYTDGTGFQPKSLQVLACIRT